MATNDIAELVVRIKADASRLESEMKRAGGVVQQAGGKMQSSLAGVATAARGLLPALGVAGIVSFAQAAINAGDALNDMSIRTGVSVEALSSLQLGAQLADVSMEQLGQALQFMNRNLENSPQAFEKLGINIAQFRSLRTEEQFVQIADKISQLGTVSERTAALMSIFGRSGVELAVLMEKGAEGIQEAINKSKELGLVLSSEEAARMAEFNDTWDAMTLSLIRLGQDGFLFAARAARQFKLGLQGATNDPLRGALNAARLGTPLPNTKLEGQAAWEAKSRAGGFVTTASEMYGPPMPARQVTAPAVRQAAEAAIKQTNAKVEADRKQADAAEKATKATDAFADSLRYDLAQGLTQAAFGAGSAGNAFRQMAMQIAQSIFTNNISKPLGDAASGLFSEVIGGSGIGGFFKDLLPSFDVGAMNLPRDMIAQVHKGEMIIPAAQANQIRSGGGLGGVTVVQNNTFGNGVNRAELQAMLPQVAKAAHDAVFTSMQRGGSASKIAGLR